MKKQENKRFDIRGIHRKDNEKKENSKQWKTNVRRGTLKCKKKLGIERKET
jgi:hypothetical protein